VGVVGVVGDLEIAATIEDTDDWLLACSPSWPTDKGQKALPSITTISDPV
jgi:hypothetical protein